jgi:hypothetical protein
VGKFVKQQCLYSRYDPDFAAFKEAIQDGLSQTTTGHKPVLDSLWALNFQTFKKAQVVPA